MPSAFDLSSSDPIMILLKAPVGFGKTLAASTMCVDGPIFMAYWDKKSPIELKNFYENTVKRPDLLKNIEYEVYSADNPHMFLNKLIEFKKNGCPYVGIVNDGITMMTASAVGWSMAFRNPARGKTDTLSPDSPQLIPDWDEYKVETSLVLQCIDLCKLLPVNSIWTCHPINSTKIEDAGGKVKITKVNKIVSYGSKVAEIAPGQFTEIYHIGQESSWNAQLGKSQIKRIVHTVGIGDDFAKTALNLPEEIDITNKLFWEEWKKVKK